MNHASHHSDANVRTARRAGSKVRHAKPLALLLSGLILIAAIAPAAATPTSCERPTGRTIIKPSQMCKNQWFEEDQANAEKEEQVAPEAKAGAKQTEKGEIQLQKGRSILDRH
jgi:hypothetical protein